MGKDFSRSLFSRCSQTVVQKTPRAIRKAPIKSLGSSVHPRVPCGLCFLLTLDRSFPKAPRIPKSKANWASLFVRSALPKLLPLSLVAHYNLCVTMPK